MTILRTDVDTILIQRRGTQITSLGLDGVTIDGTNVVLNDPVASAVRALGGTTASPVTATDADIATITSLYLNGIFTVAEYFLVRKLLSQLTQQNAVDITSGPFSAKLSQWAKMLQQDLDRLGREIEDEWGVGAVEIEAGIVTLNIASHDDADI
jgi:hypothetical protein